MGLFKRSLNARERWHKKGLFVNLGRTTIVFVRSTDRVSAPEREPECPQPQVPEREAYSIVEELLEQEQYGLVEPFSRP